MKHIKTGFSLLLAVITMISVAASFSFAAVAAEETYLRGDADGNRVVDVRDATLIQRVLAELTDDTDGRIALRADVTGDGLDISDATQIQMYAAEYENLYDIGKEVAYPQPTTEAQTTKPKPTRDPYELPFIPND